MAAKLIAARNTLGMRRQIFFCSVGGYDTHEDELASQTDLLAELSQCMNAFYQATMELGVADRVTTFHRIRFRPHLSIKRFGRGSRLGKSCARSRRIGQAAATSTALIRHLFSMGPTTSVKDDGCRQLRSMNIQSTLAKWFGVSSQSDLAAVLPNISRFGHPDLGFMNALPDPPPPGS